LQVFLEDIDPALLFFDENFELQISI